MGDNGFTFLLYHCCRGWTCCWLECGSDCKIWSSHGSHHGRSTTLVELQEIPFRIKELPSGRNLYTASLMELWSTIKELGKSAPGAQRFLIMLMFSGASILTLVTLFIAWFNDFLEVSAKTTVIFVLIQFACNPIGVIIHRALARRFGHKRNFCVMLIFWIILLALHLITPRWTGERKICAYN